MSSRRARAALRGPVTRGLALVVVAALASVVCHAEQVGATGADSSTTTTNYVASNDLIANPERGFHHLPGDCDLPGFTSSLGGYRDQKISLVQCVFYLKDFKNSPISAEHLGRFELRAKAVRDAGLKMILRFAYTKSTTGDDASPDWVQAHLNQLAPLLVRYSHVIDVVQSGFVGAWGEGYYTQNFGDRGALSEDNWKNREAIVHTLLRILPGTRKVQFRTLAMKTHMFGTTAATAADADAGRDIARVGHHNDCFLGSPKDSGTYDNPAIEYPYLAADTNYVPMGGETCRVNSPRSDCPTALQELNMFHYSYLNADHKAEVLGNWETQGCKAEIERRLGYRFTLVSVTSPTAVSRGTNLAFQMTIRNDGWSRAINLRRVQLVLRHTTTGAVHKLALTNTRTWAAGTTVTFTHRGVPIPPTMPAGTYALLLNFPDAGELLADLPAYAIQLANNGLWENSTGFNRLQRTVQVQ